MVRPSAESPARGSLRSSHLESPCRVGDLRWLRCEAVHGRASTSPRGRHPPATVTAQPSRRRIAVARTTASPASSEASRSTGGLDHPVVVALGVVQGLADPPAARSARPPRSRSGPRASGVEPRPGRARRSRPRSPRPSPSASSRPPRAGRSARRRPARGATSPSRSSRATSSTRRHIALRIITRNGRVLLEIGPRRGRRLVAGHGGPGTCLGVGERLPLVEQRGVGLPDRLPQPLDEVLELGGAVRVGHRLPQRPVGVGEVAQHQPLGPGQLVAADEVGERSSPARTSRARPTWARARPRVSHGWLWR